MIELKSRDEKRIRRAKLKKVSDTDLLTKLGMLFHSEHQEAMTGDCTFFRSAAEG